MSTAGAIINSDHNFWPGQLALVRVKGRGEVVVKILKRNPKNYRALLEDGSHINGSHVLFNPVPAGAVFNPTAEVTRVDTIRHLLNGTVVRAVAGTYLSLKEGDKLFVVVNCDREGKHRLFPLGGDSRYYRGIPGTELTVVPVEDINA